LIAAGVLFLAAAAAAPVPGQTAFARDIEIRQPVAGRVVAVLSDVGSPRPCRATSSVGRPRDLQPAGSVAGNLSVFGGGISAPAGQPLPVRGIVSTPGTLLRLYLDETHQPPWQEGARSLVAGCA
jgi:hypothetical protein